MMNYVMLASGWILYFFIHSILAANGVKRWVGLRWKGGFRYYRLFYTFLSTAGLVGLLLYGGSIKSDYYFGREGLIRYLSLMFTTFGVMTIQLAFRNYDLKAFLGLCEEKKELATGGILSYVRHPVYSGLILVTIGFFLFIPNAPTLTSCLCIFCYLPLGIFLEEKKLIVIFGEQYRAYRDKVPSIIPRFPLRSQG
jgi:protein-S-isoprenylcysteine O-methyltransferase Ste14